MLERRRADNGVVYYQSPLLRARGVPHAFSTRIGGQSPPPFDSLNLGNPSGCTAQDDYPRIYDNYRLLQTAIGVNDRTRCWVHQVHGGAVVGVPRGSAFESGVKADAMVTDDPAKLLAVRVADCVPVLIATDDGGIVAAVHAGWRGVIAGIVPTALREVIDRWDRGASLPRHPDGRGSDARELGVERRSNAGIPHVATAPLGVTRVGHRASGRLRVVAAIGPCIGFEHFEVGPEVLDQFERAFAGHIPLKRRDDGKGHVDLRAAIRLQLLDAGVADDRIDTSDRCTVRDIGEFFSHRRDRGVTGRMAALISPKGT